MYEIKGYNGLKRNRKLNQFLINPRYILGQPIFQYSIFLQDTDLNYSSLLCIQSSCCVFVNIGLHAGNCFSLC